jgi:hypothetical protein
MILRMRTTLVIDAALFRELKRRAAAEDRTLSEVTQEALRRGLALPRRPRRRARLKIRSFSMGRAAVDVADRDQLYDILDRS